MQSTNSSMNFPLQLEEVLSQTGRENCVFVACLLLLKCGGQVFYEAVFFSAALCSQSFHRSWVELWGCLDELPPPSRQNDGDGLSMPNVPGEIASQDLLCWLLAKLAWSSEKLCTSASTHHGLGTRCRFHAFADVLSIRTGLLNFGLAWGLTKVLLLVSEAWKEPSCPCLQS